MTSPTPIPRTRLEALVRQYEVVLRRLHALAARDDDADALERRALRDEQVRLIDEIGPATAGMVARLCARDFDDPNKPGGEHS